MPSPLEVIDIVDLTANEMVTTFGLYASAFQERYTLCIMDDSTTQSYGAQPTVLAEQFPYGTNTPEYRQDIGDPLICNGSSFDVMNTTIRQDYADIVKNQDLIGTTTSFSRLKDLDEPADDPQYNNRLEEVIGSAIPDFNYTILPSEITRLRKVIETCQYPIVNYDTRVDTMTAFGVYSDIEKEPAIFPFSPDYSKRYGTGGLIAEYGQATWDSFKADHDSLMVGTRSDLPTEATSWAPFQGNGALYYDHRIVYNADPGAGYHVYQIGFTQKYNYQITNPQTNFGFSGVPQSVYSLQKMTDTNPITTSDGYTYATSGLVDGEIFEESMTATTATGVTSYNVAPNFTLAVIPTTIMSHPTSTVSVQSEIIQQIEGSAFFFDYDGGFEYYTP